MTLIESFIEFIYKIYIMLMGWAAPFRMAFIIAVFGMIMPYLLKVLLFLTKKIVGGLSGLFTVLAKNLGERIVNRRNKGKNPFFGTGFVDALLSVLIIIFSKSVTVLNKKQKFHPKTRKNYTLIIIACAVIFPIWGAISPTSTIGSTWSRFELNLVNQHLVKLGYDPQTYKSLARFSAELTLFKKKEVASTQPDVKEEASFIQPNSKSKNGVYIRKGPDKSSKSLDVLAYGEKAQYLGENKKSSNGVTWYKIQTKGKITGWVSERVTVFSR